MTLYFTFKYLFIVGNEEEREEDEEEFNAICTKEIQKKMKDIRMKNKREEAHLSEK